MKFRYPDPDSLSDESIGEALASSAIEGYPFLDPEGNPYPKEERVEAFREFLRRERARQLQNASDEQPLK